MRKTLVILLVLAMLCTVFVGCDSGGSNSASSPEASSQTPSEDASEPESSEDVAEEPVGDETDDGEIRVAGIWDATAGDGAVFQRIADEYVAMNPDFEYTYEYFVQNDMSEYLSVLVAADDLPDAFAMEHNTLVEPYSNAGLLVEFEEVYSAVGLNAEDYVKSGAFACCAINISDGKHWVWPVTNNAEGLWINTKTVEDAGVTLPTEDWTFDEMYQFCDELLAAGVQPIALGASNQWPTTRWLVCYTARALGATAHMEASWDKIDFMDPAFIEAGDRLQMMNEKGYFGEGALSLDGDNAGAMVANGQAAMLYNGSWTISSFLSTNEDSLNDILLYPIPYLPESKISMDEQKSTYSINCGTGLCFVKSHFKEGEGLGYIKYLFENIGDVQAENGVCGAHFVQNPDKIDSKLNVLNDQVSEAIEATEYATQWWEAQMDANATDGSLTNSDLLLTGAMSSEEFFQACKDAAVKQAGG